MKIGDKIRIIEMQGEPRYAGRTGIIEYVDDIGQIHGTWGYLALIPGTDNFITIESEIDKTDNNTSTVRWIPINEQCPEEDDGEYLVTLKSGRVTFASYWADEDGDYWRCLDRDDTDEFFVTDSVVAWAEYPASYKFIK